MFRLWGKIWKDNHLVRDAVAEEAGDDTRTHKVFHTLDELCREFDLGPDFIRTALSRRLILIIWKFRYWRNDFESM